MLNNNINLGSELGHSASDAKPDAPEHEQALGKLPDGIIAVLSTHNVTTAVNGPEEPAIEQQRYLDHMEVYAKELAEQKGVELVGSTGDIENLSAIVDVLSGMDCKDCSASLSLSSPIVALGEMSKAAVGLVNA
jgi:phage I-like protein